MDDFSGFPRRALRSGVDDLPLPAGGLNVGVVAGSRFRHVAPGVSFLRHDGVELGESLGRVEDMVFGFVLLRDGR